MFSDREQERLQKLTDVYVKCKAIILYVEQIDVDSSANIQIPKELRDAFDHICQVLAIKFGINGKPDQETLDYSDKVLMQIEKSIGHVYRAGFDALDGAVISLSDSIKSILRGYDADIINEVVPDYWEKKKSINSLMERVANHRNGRTELEITSEMFDDYISDVEELKKVHKDFLDHAKNLNERQRELKRKDISNTVNNLLIAIIGALVGGIVTYLLLTWQ